MAAQQALRRLATTPDGKVLLTILTVDLDDNMDKLKMTPLEHVPRLQGRVQVLDELVLALKKI